MWRASLAVAGPKTPRWRPGILKAMLPRLAGGPSAATAAKAARRAPSVLKGPPVVTPEKFQEKWETATRTEKSGAIEHFLDLCELLGVDKPADVDKHSKSYTFEKLTTRADKGGKAFADVWREGCFVWEYKGKRRTLREAYGQARLYAADLGNPPLLIVSDMKEIQVYTNFTGLPTQVTVFQFRDLNDPKNRRRLKDAFAQPENWRPDATRESVTRDAAVKFGRIANRLRQRGDDPQAVAHFLNRLVFCLFAEDIDLLPDRIFAEILEESAKDQTKFAPMLKDLFRAMRKKNGRFGTATIPWFNGGLFEDDDVLELGHLEILDLVDAALLDWAAIEPSIFGTLFEQGLNPEKRKAMAGLFDAPTAPTRQKGLFDKHGPDKGVGIHYTDPATIMKIVEPVVLAPLRREWEEVKAEIAKHREAKLKARGASKTKAEEAARDAYLKFRDRLGRFRVLDPACGSGNFLYLALSHLKDFDLRVQDEARTLDLPLDAERVTPEAVLGIEINPYAAEIARVTMWIGELQWQVRKGLSITRRPILGTLHQIECRDALLAPDGSEAKWPKADVVIGNPPFLGGTEMPEKLGIEYTERVRSVYGDRLPSRVDLVAYWFEKCRSLIEQNSLNVSGLVATQAIRRGVNRTALDRISANETIFDAWANMPWSIDGADVRVSLVCFGHPGTEHKVFLDGGEVLHINSDLTSDATNLTQVQRLKENTRTAFQGPVKVGAFDVAGENARRWLTHSGNPHGRPNSDVIRPWVNGMDIVRRPSDTWIIDFAELTENEAALYERPFEYVVQEIKLGRLANRDTQRRTHWWRLGRSGNDLKQSIASLDRYIATPRVSKHRLFVWMHKMVLPDSRVNAIARHDDTSFGVLHSRFHETWSLRLGGWHGVGNDPQYTPSTGFETFPFPEGLSPNIPAKDYAQDPRAIAIAAAAKRLNELRENWLNPSDLVKRVAEVVPGFPDRILPVSAAAAATLKKRTLTNLYNEPPAWLANAHRDLDAAVAAAYGWPDDISDDDALAKLFALNQERAAKQGS